MTAASTAAVGTKAQNRRPPAVRSSNTSGTIVAATTAGTVTKPAGVRVGDVLLVAAQLASVVDTLATPSGWSLLFGPISTTGAGTNTRGYLFSRTADGTEASSLAFTKTGTNASWRLTAICVTDTAGVGASASNTVANATTDTAPVLATITPTVDKSTVIGVVIVRNTTTVTVPAHYVDVTQATGNSFNIDFCRRGPIDSGGALGTATGSVGTTSKWVTFTVELKHT